MANAGATSSLLAHAAATVPACPSTLFFKSARKSTAAGPCHGGGRRRHHRRRAMMTTCRAAGGSSGGDDQEGLLWLPRRRDMITGLTGVAAGLTTYPGLASAALPMLEEQCRRGDKVSDALVKCTDRGAPCPPTSTTNPIVVDFQKESTVNRIRKPVHLLTGEEQSIYRKAVAKMKALPADHPLSFTAQAAIHEAYCDGHYRYDPTEKNRPFDVHSSWIFAPWHRMYIFFYERALRALLKADENPELARAADTFALPYWNWDAPAGMALPAIFKDPSTDNSLYDAKRDSKHLDALIDLDFASTHSEPIPFKETTNKAYDKAVERNLCTIYQQQVRMAKGARCFHGDKLCSQTSFVMNEINERSRRRLDPRTKLTKVRGSNSGSLESMAHASVHVWTGRPNVSDQPECAMGHDRVQHCSNDMGFLGSASRDPVFYSHHANVDRMWYLWRRLGGKDFQDAEWKDASFVFYDAGGVNGDVNNPQLVRIKVGDVLDTTKLGYAYADDYKIKDVDKPNEYYKDDDVAKWKETLPWINSKPTRLVPSIAADADADAASTKMTMEDPRSFIPLPLEVDQVLVLPVALPPKVAGKLRVLEIEGIEYDPSKSVKVNVAINVAPEFATLIGPQHSEYAGSFVRIDSSKPKEKEEEMDGGDEEKKKKKEPPPPEPQVGKVSLVLDDVLADVGAEDDKSVNVVVVRRSSPSGKEEGQMTLTLPPVIRNEDFC